jgi:predicted RNA-binding Zn-ribbon protein involved in translation (DUF1610 family)
MPGITTSTAIAVTTSLSIRHCPTCGDDRTMEQPPCAEHAECPEWICVECGTGIVVGWLAVDAPSPTGGSRRIDTAA